MSDILELESFLPYRLNRLADAVSREFSAIYRQKFGLTRPEWRLLATLGQYETMTATDIGRHSAMHKTKVSRAVTALEKRRWLARETNEADRRIEHLRLTKAGQDAYREMVPLAKEFESRLMAHLAVRERSTVSSGLRRLERVVLHTDRVAGGEAPPVEYPRPGVALIGGIELVCTCSAMPEQYDAFLDGRQVGYLRLRHGNFTVEWPDVGGELVYEASPMGDGDFEDEEREFYLVEAVRALKACLG